MKQIEVTILGQSYVLGCPPGGDDGLMAAVKAVDHEMTSIRNAGKVKARERIAVLAALNLAYALAQRGDGKLPPSEFGGLSADVDAHIDVLMRRIDTALGDDGQLL